MIARRPTPTRALFTATYTGALLVMCVACAGRAYPITRVMDEQTRPGVYVSPYAYEHFLRAELAVAHGDDLGALPLYAAARTGPVDDPYVIARMVSAHIRLGREDPRHLVTAERLIEEGLTLDPESEPLWLVRGDLHRARGALAEASAAYAEAARLAPRSSAPIGRLSALLADTPEARQALRQLADTETPENETANADRQQALHRAALHLALFDEDATQAALAARRLMATAPLFAVEIQRLAEMQLESGSAPMALALLQHPALQRPETLSLRVRATALTQSNDEAKELLLADPSGSHLERATLWRFTGEALLCSEEAQHALAEERGDALDQARLLAAWAAIQLGRPGEGLQHLAAIETNAPARAEANVLMRQAQGDDAEVD